MTAPFCTIKDTPVYFQEDWKTGIGGGLWSTGLAMAEYLRLHPEHARAQLTRQGRHRKALELGSGNGFLAVCWLAVGANEFWSDLLVTDFKDHCPLMQQTIDANKHLLRETNVGVCEHEWGRFDTEATDDSIVGRMQAGQEKFDFIFGSDLAYREELYDPLISSLQRFSHQNTIIMIGVTMNDTTPAFFDMLLANGFTYKRLSDYLMAEKFRGNTFGIFIIRRLK